MIELLVVLVICAIVIGGIYKIFIAQTKMYAVQDQVAEVQQDVRGAMEIMLRDIRMAGFQTNTFNNATISSTPVVPDPANNSHITVNYEYINTAFIPLIATSATAYQVDYQLVTTAQNPSCSNPPCLQRTCTSTLPVPQCNPANQDLLLGNVTNLTFAYGEDNTGNGVMDNLDLNNPEAGIIPNAAFKLAANVPATAKVQAVQITLTAKPTAVDPDIPKMVSPRTLITAVTLRNLFFKRYTAY